ncbi:MAG: hypothetical protein ACRCZ5_07340, partial [Burkholderiales bacterium]
YFLRISFHMQDSLTLQPIARVNGTVNLPGSKSVSSSATELGKQSLLSELPACGTQQFARAVNKSAYS